MAVNILYIYIYIKKKKYIYREKKRNLSIIEIRVELIEKRGFYFYLKNKRWTIIEHIARREL